MADVKQALAASLAANTAEFRVDLAVEAPGGGVLTMTREGTYDASARVAGWELSFYAPPDVAKALDIEDLDALSRQCVTTEGAIYEQVPARSAVAPGKWSRQSVEQLGGEHGDELETTPGLLLVLDHIKPRLAQPSTASTAYVRVPASVGILALPGSSVRNLVAAGVDLDKLTGDMVLEVHIHADRRISAVHVKAGDVLHRAYRLTRKPMPRQVASIDATLFLDHYGVRSEVTVPRGKQLLTPAETAQLQAGPTFRT